VTCSPPDLRPCPSERVTISLTSFIAQFDRFPRMLLAIWSGRNHETTVDTPLSKRAVWETSSGRSANPEFSLPPFAFDYHEPRVEASLHKPTVNRAIGHAS
jgi:hypothetical protein